jgi:uncharacterized delta-60 repeat protein
MKSRSLIFLAMIILFILFLQPASHAWTGDMWCSISRETITNIASEMIDSTWSPKNTIRNWEYGSQWNYFYSGTTYRGIAYSQNNPQENWPEFFNLISTTSGGDTYYGNDCSGFVSISWKLPARYTTTSFETDLGGDYFYALGEIGDGPYVSLLQGDALNDDGNHIILFNRYLSGGVESMEQTPPTATRRVWTWSQLSTYRPIRRSLLEDSLKVGDRIQTSYNLNVRICPSISCTIIAVEPTGAKGTIIGGPQNADKYRWWQISYDDGVTGWSVEGYLVKISGETLSVTLTANPSSGTAPLSTNLTADVSGTATGTINYTFWWNCNDPGTSVSNVMAVCGSIPTPAWGTCTSNENGYKCDGVWDDPKVVNHTYSSAGTYTAKVIAERGSAPPAESRTTINVTTPFNYSLSNSGNITVTQGSSGSNTITATLTSGSTQSVSFSASGLPSGATYSFSPTSCNPTCYTTLTISTSASTPAGTYTITVTGSPLSKTTTFSLIVNAPPETVSTPTTPTGPTSGTTGTSYTYATGGSVSNQGHSVQYLIDWGDGTNSSWLSVGTTSAPHIWSSPGTYCVKAKARCATHTSVESGWSGCLNVTISTTRTLTVNSSNPSSGVSITISPNDNNGQGSGTTPFTRIYNNGTSVTLTAPSTAGGNTFSSWTGCNSTSGTTCYVTMDANKTVTANYSTVTYTLSVLKSGSGSGTVTSNPSGINCGTDCTESYPANTTVTLTATPSSGSTFGSWGDDCSGCGTNATCQIIMNSDKTCSAVFNTSAGQYTLTVTKSGTGSGTVNTTGCTLSWNGNTGTCTADHGTSITLSATANTGSTFTGWSNGTGSASSCTGTGNCIFTITQNSGVTATFTLNQYTITTIANPSTGGSVTCSPNPVDYGSSSTCTITPNTGYHIVDVKVDGVSQGAITSYTFTNVTSAHTIEATFTLNTSAAQWAKTYGGSDSEGAYSIQQTSDGGYIVAGETESFGAGNFDLWVLKLDSSGNIQWQKTYGGSDRDWAYSIQQTSDGGYIVAGETYSFGAGDSDFWVLKLDSSGNIQWQKTYGGTDYDSANSIQQTSDGGYIVAGGTDSFGAGWGDFWVLKLDADGNIQWQKTYGGTDGDRARSIQQTKDGGYIVAGHTYSFGAGYSDFWVLKLDANGNIQWQKTYGGSNWDWANSIQQTSDGGYIVAGRTWSFGAGWGDFWVLKLDADGNVQWQKTYGGISSDWAHSIQQTSDGGYIVAGETYSFGAGSADLWVLKLDSSGNIQWQKTYGGTDYDSANSIQQTTDGGYIVAGVTESFGAGNFDLWVLKLDSNGNITGCSAERSSNATVNTTDVSGNDSSATVASTSVNPATSNATINNTNASLIDSCYYTPPTYILSVLKSGSGSGTVTSNPSGISCGTDCTESYPANTTVTLTATSSSGSTFGGWGGDCSSCDTNDTCQIIMNSDKTCSAVFNTSAGQYNLTVTKAGTGSGTVNATGCTLSWNGNTGTCTADHGTSITLSATANTGSTFTGWSNGTGSASSCTGTGNCTFTITSDSSVTATFTLNQYTITTIANPSTGGSVTCSPNPVDYGSSSTCTITPNTGYHIVDVKVDGVSQGAITSYTFTNVTSAHTIEATFTLNTSAAQWAKTYGGSDLDFAYSIQQTSDGGYIVAGGTSSFGAGSVDFWVLKLDSSGNIQWQKTYGGSSDDRAYSIQQTSDGGYIVAGKTTSFGAGGDDFWVLKLDSSGNIQWQKTYGGTSDDEAYSIQQTTDGGYIVAGRTWSFGTGDDDAWVLKLDANGNVVWQKTYGGTSWDWAESIQQTSDGGYIVAGDTSSFGAGAVDAWVLKLDTNGNVQWAKTYGGGANDYASSIQQTSDGGYIVVGWIGYLGGYTANSWVLKLDANGNIQWQKTYGDAGANVIQSISIKQTLDGGYIVASWTGSIFASDDNVDVWLLKLDPNGSVQWRKTYGGTSHDNVSSIQQTSDGGYIMAGWTWSFGGWRVWVLKLDDDGDIPDCPLGRTSNPISSNTNAIVGTPTITSSYNTNATITIPSIIITDTNATVGVMTAHPVAQMLHVR